MKKWVLCLLLLHILAQVSEAQPSRYIIKFRNKATNPYALNNPSTYLSSKAIDRRNRYGIAIDSTDLPVTPRYIDSIRLAGNVTILNVSKWLNSVSIQTTDVSALAKISSFSFVQSTSTAAARLAATRDKSESFFSQKSSHRESGIEADYFNYGNSYNQVHIHNGEFLHNIGLRGKGIGIGMLDAGYFGYQSLKAFDSVRAGGQILDTWDFVAREASVNEDNLHGMQCFSTIAANIPGQFVGTAPKANFYLFRTEDNSSEYPIEEHNWVCGAERVDSAGGDMISSSVGYNLFDDPSLSHTYADMNGNTTMAAIGADLAAKKGILVVNSAGNEGNKAWGKIITPADGDSVLAVGAVDVNRSPAGFTSRGPSSDGQIKPDVASLGVATVIQLTNNTIGSGSGTSFAGPNLAGLAACLWEGFPEFNNMRIIDALRQSGSRASLPNDTIGYGIPDMKKAFLVLLKQFATTTVSVTNCKAGLTWKSKDIQAMKYEIERRVSGQTNFTKVGEVAAKGESFGLQTYSYNDDLVDVPAGTVLYRIRQVIDTTAAGFSADYIDTASSELSSSCLSGKNEIVLLPNPSRGSLKIKITTQTALENMVIRISNSAGQIVYEIKTSKAAGIAFIDFPVFSLASGKYYVTLLNGKTKLETKELIKL